MRGATTVGERCECGTWMVQERYMNGAFTLTYHISGDITLPIGNDGWVVRSLPLLVFCFGTSLTLPDSLGTATLLLILPHVSLPS